MQKLLLFTIIWLVAAFGGNAQTDNCTLDIGGKNKDVLVQVFQFNEQQQAQLETWSVELALQSKILEEEMQFLLDSHPQSTEADLKNLARKYARLKDKLLGTSLEYDQKLLGLFNEKQYEFYVKLCGEAMRKPLAPHVQEEKNEEPGESPDQDH